MTGTAAPTPAEPGPADLGLEVLREARDQSVGQLVHGLIREWLQEQRGGVPPAGSPSGPPFDPPCGVGGEHVPAAGRRVQVVASRWAAGRRGFEVIKVAG